MLTTATIGTRANGGLMILIGDGTNRVGYPVGGDDFAPFRVDRNGLVGYMCFCIDTSKLSTWSVTPVVQNGSRASLEANLNAITQIGTGCQVLAKAIGGVVNYWNDIIRHGIATDISSSGITISGGTSGNPGKFTEIEVEDRSIANLKAHGVIRELGTGVFGVQGTLRFGDQGTGSSWFEDKDVTIVFESRGFDVTRYKIVITDNGTGTTTFKLGTKVGSGTDALGAEGCTFIVPASDGASWDSATDTDVTDVFIYGTIFNGFTQGISFRDPQEWINNTFVRCGQINPNGAVMVNSIIVNSVASSALLWNINSNTSGKLNGCSFTSAGTGHAIELGSNTPASIDFNDISFVGYGANGTTDAAIYNNSGKEIDIYLSGGTTPTVRNGSGSTTNIIVSATLTLTGLPTGTLVTIVEVADRDNVLFQTNAGGSGIVSYSYGGAEAGLVVDILFMNTAYDPNIGDLLNFTLSSENQTIPISLIIDRTYIE